MEYLRYFILDLYYRFKLRRYLYIIIGSKLLLWTYKQMPHAVASAVFNTRSVKGDVTFTNKGASVVVEAVFTKLPAGEHGFHIHRRVIYAGKDVRGRVRISIRESNLAHTAGHLAPRVRGILVIWEISLGPVRTCIPYEAYRPRSSLGVLSLSMKMSTISD